MNAPATSLPTDDVPGTAPSLRRLALGWLVACALLLGAALLVLWDLASSNRPHELDSAPWVAGITLLNLLLCVRLGVGLLRRGRARPGSAGKRLGWRALFLGVIAVAFVDTWILVGALSLIPAVLGS